MTAPTLVRKTTTVEFSGGEEGIHYPPEWATDPDIQYGTQLDPGIKTYWVTEYYSDGSQVRRGATGEEIAIYKNTFKSLEVRDWGYGDGSI
jgi:hypothetical protein